jgi:hypothetical protein
MDSFMTNMECSGFSEARKKHSGAINLIQIHPLCGQAVPLLTRRFAWGEERIFFLDPHT